MYVLDYLAGRLNGDGVTEYRLLCSGELYSSNVLVADWRKSEATRSLLKQPIGLTVVSRPFNDYPQELSLCFSCLDSVRETSGASSLMLRPDDEISQDLAALLTLFVRRLITVYTKVRITYTNAPHMPPGETTEPYEFPLPIATSGTNASWKQKPVSVISSLEGIREIIDPNPQPLAVDRNSLSSKLTTLPEITHAESYVLSARLYAQAMRVLEEWPEIAYQLLVYSVETIANKAFTGYSPPRNELIAEKRKVAERAQAMGIPKEDADELAVLACKGMPWAGRKFRMFLKGMTDESLWCPDDLFRGASGVHFSPTAAHFEQVLKNIYNSRSEAVHEGQPYGASIDVGIGPTVSVRALHELLSKHPLKVPPVCWFERVVNLALNRYLVAGGRLDTAVLG
jgi:hypothetical protein